MRSRLQENISEGGFTLLELIIVLTLVSILSAISRPFFKSFIRKVHSAAGKTSITNIKKECRTRWYQANFSFWDWKTFTPQCPLVEN